MKMYLVGGKVRDDLLGIQNDDVDYVVVGATPADMRELGYENVGQSFPVYMDPATGDQYALARREKKTGVGYGGFSVDFDPSVSLYEDLARRDLTINSMAQDLETGQIVDYYGGRQDLENRILRHTSDAFVEDPLRVVRLARFYARFSTFNLAIETVALAQHIVASGEMETISPERYWAEMEKMFYQSDKPERFFQALHLFGALNGVKFFNKMFGQVNEIYLDNVIVPLAKHSIKFAEPVMVFVPAASAKNAEFVKGSSRLVAVHAALQEFVNKFFSDNPLIASDIFEMAKSVGAANRKSEGLGDLLTVIRMLETIKTPVSGKAFNCRIGSDDFEKFVEIMISVTSAPYLHLSGKAIGDAMNAEKIMRIASVL